MGAFERNQSDAMTFILDAELIYDVQYQNSKSHGITCQMTPPPKLFLFLILPSITGTFLQLYNRFGAERLETKPPDSILMMGVFVFWEVDNAAVQQIGFYQLAGNERIVMKSPYA